MNYEQLRKRLSTRWKGLRKKARNTVQAFQSGELWYRLAIAEIDGFEIAYRKGSSDESQLRHSFSRDEFLSAVPEYVPRAGDVILDVGAHIGTFALLAGRQNPDGVVYSLEPSEESFNYLRINIRLNNAANVRPFRLALNAESGDVKLYHGLEHLGHSLTRASGEFEIVPATTLEHFLAANAIEQCAFVKFNCEGAEFPILLGAAAPVIRRFRNLLVLFHTDLAPQYDHQQLVDHLAAAGFRTRVERQRKGRGWIIATNSSQTFPKG